MDNIPLIPLKDFFRNPEKSGFSISPNGEYVAFLQPWEKRMNIHIQKLESDKVVRITDTKKRDILSFFWANNSRIAYFRDNAGDEDFRLYAVNIDGKNEIELTPFEKTRTMLVDKLEDNDNEVLIGLNKRDPKVHDVYKININSGEMQLVVENPGNISSWITDHEGKVRAAVSTDGVNNSFLYRKNQKDEFKTIATTNFRETIAPQMFTFDNRYLYMASNIGRDKISIVKYDPDEEKELEVVYEHQEVDVSALLASKKRKIITGTVCVTWKSQYHFFDKERQQLQEYLEQQLSGYEVAIVSMNKEEDRMIVRTYSDKSLGAYYYYEVVSQKLRKLIDVSPWLNEKHMADQKPISYTSKDGLTIHGYLTLPQGKEKNLPLVVNVHGGPWARDIWGYDKECQFFANRSYAVLQINFRGSTGYGREFWEKGFKQWGKTMQNDITDGVEWLISQKIADPKKIAIYGGSYGGYAVLAGLAFTPNLYACGVDYVGVSNLFTFMKTIPPYWEPFIEMMYEMVGHPEKDKEMMEAASPVFHVDKIKSPLFIAQGANDPRVNKDESDQMVKALKEKGIDVPYMVKDNEGHGFLNEENRFDFYREVEKFLAKYLSGK